MMKARWRAVSQLQVAVHHGSDHVEEGPTDTKASSQCLVVGEQEDEAEYIGYELS
jgi:hypothetical protein